MNNEPSQYPSFEQIEASKKALEEACGPGPYYVISGQHWEYAKTPPTRRKKPTLQEVIDIDRRQVNAPIRPQKL